MGSDFIYFIKCNAINITFTFKYLIYNTLVGIMMLFFKYILINQKLSH